MTAADSGSGPCSKLANARSRKISKSQTAGHWSRKAWRRLVVGLLAWAFLALGIAQGASQNILINGDLTRGTGSSPDHWKSDAWQTGPDFSTYTWHRAGAAPGELEVTNQKPNDARWAQSVHLAPGWYHCTADVRAEGVGENNTGATFSVLEDGITSEQLHGTTAWKTLGLYLKVGQSGADVALACRVGGYASLNTGTVFCRNLSAVKIEQPPADASAKFDLDVIRNVSAPPPAENADNSSQVTLLFLAAIIALGALFGTRAVPSALLEGIRRARPISAPPAAHDAPSDKARRQTEIALFLVCLMTFAYFYQASDHSTASRIDLIRALLERRTLWIDGYAGYNTADIVEMHSHIYSNKAPGGAFTGLLPWTFITPILGLFVSPPSGFFWAFATYLTTLFSVSLVTAMLAVLMYRVTLMFGAGNTRAIALALTLAFGTILFPYATEFTSEPISAFCEFAAFYMLALPQHDDDPWWQSLFPGLLAGWGVLCDYPTFLLAATVGGYAVWRLKSWSKILSFAAGALVVADLLMIYDKFAFNNPFFLSYEAYMLPGSDRFAAQAKGFAGVTYPKLSILGDILVFPQRGLLFCNPVLLLAAPGLYFFWRQEKLRPEFITVTFAILALTLLNASYGDSIVYWGGGTAVGPRHFVPVLPFVVLALAFLPDKINSPFGGLALISAFLMLMVTAVEPHLPYEYPHPFSQFVWPAYLRGDLAYNKSTYFGGAPVAGDSVAFNLGKLIGLPGAIQLWPLAAVWIWAAIHFQRRAESLRSDSGLRRLDAVAILAIAAIFAPPTLGAIFARPSMDDPHGLLGCYYEGLRPSGSFPPHIRRVDSQVDFNTIAEMGALPSPSSVVWRGKIVAPTAGQYTFTIAVDDLGWLKIDGKTVIADPGDVAKPRDGGNVNLSAGEHSIEVGERNIWGDSSIHLAWQPPGGAVQVVPSEYLIPETSDCRPG